jgi:hypothetical protein
MEDVTARLWQLSDEPRKAGSLAPTSPWVFQSSSSPSRGEIGLSISRDTFGGSTLSDARAFQSSTLDSFSTVDTRPLRPKLPPRIERPQRVFPLSSDATGYLIATCAPKKGTRKKESVAPSRTPTPPEDLVDRSVRMKERVSVLEMVGAEKSKSGTRPQRSAQLNKLWPAEQNVLLPLLGDIVPSDVFDGALARPELDAFQVPGRVVQAIPRRAGERESENEIIKLMAEYRYEWVLRVMRHETAAWHAPPRKRSKPPIAPWPPPKLSDDSCIPGRTKKPFAKWLMDDSAAREGEDGIAPYFKQDFTTKAHSPRELEKLQAAEDKEKPMDDEEFRAGLSKWFRSVVGYRGRMAGQRTAVIASDVQLPA